MGLLSNFLKSLGGISAKDEDVIRKGFQAIRDYEKTAREWADANAELEIAYRKCPALREKLNWPAGIDIDEYVKEYKKRKKLAKAEKAKSKEEDSAKSNKNSNSKKKISSTRAAYERAKNIKKTH